MAEQSAANSHQISSSSSAAACRHVFELASLLPAKQRPESAVGSTGLQLARILCLAASVGPMVDRGKDAGFALDEPSFISPALFYAQVWRLEQITGRRAHMIFNFIASV